MERTFVKGLVAGAIIGGVAGIMFAPKTGKESRHLLASRAGQVRQKAGDAIGNMRKRTGKDQQEEMADNNGLITAN